VLANAGGRDDGYMRVALRSLTRRRTGGRRSWGRRATRHLQQPWEVARLIVEFVDELKSGAVLD
jgi:hypothetical protein